jgi:hypothetical protein
MIHFYSIESKNMRCYWVFQRYFIVFIQKKETFSKKEKTFLNCGMIKFVRVLST